MKRSDFDPLPALAGRRAGMTPAEWLVVCLIRLAVRDLFGSSRYWQRDAALYFMGENFRHDCDSIGVEPAAFSRHAGITPRVLYIMQREKMMKQLTAEAIVNDGGVEHGIELPVGTRRVYVPLGDVKFRPDVSDPTEQEYDKLPIDLEPVKVGSVTVYVGDPAPSGTVFYARG